jgi:hypothetical protein
MLALGIKIIRNAETEIRNEEVEKVFGKAGLSPTVSSVNFGCSYIGDRTLVAVARVLGVGVLIPATANESPRLEGS